MERKDNSNLLSEATIQRLCLLYGLCSDLQGEKVGRVSSVQLGQMLGVPSHSIRKDMSFLPDSGKAGVGYDVSALRTLIGEEFGLSGSVNTCIVGLGRLGSALLAFEDFRASGFPLVAGFDASTNRLETLRTNVPLYPAHRMADVVRQERISLALLCVPAEAAVRSCQLLAEGGIKGIVNFAPTVVALPAFNGIIRNVDLISELRILTAMLTVKNLKTNE